MWAYSLLLFQWTCYQHNRTLAIPILLVGNKKEANMMGFSPGAVSTLLFLAS